MIEVRDLSHRLPDGSMILDSISFRIDEGERVVLLGANGSGKTTLLRILDGLFPAGEGICVYDGTNLDAGRLRDRGFLRRFRREVVLLFQNPDAMLFNATVRDEIAFGLRQIGAPDASERVTLWAERLGIADRLGQAPFELSSGEKQKVCLAALLALDPRLLLLDEPTASLDPRSVGLLVDLLAEVDRTSLVTTHNLSLAPELGERALVLSEDHRLIYDGPVDALMEDEATLRAANLVHTHFHRHGRREHRHEHRHDWDE